MAWGEVFQADTDRVIADLARSQLPTARKERGLWATAGASIAGAGAKGVAAALEVGRVIGPALAFDPTSDESLAAVKAKPDFGESDITKPIRDYERSLRPDPQTASKAEQLVYGAVGPVASLVGGAIVAGPAGLLGASVSEGMGHAEDLRQSGVDIGTRTAVGAVTAAVTFGSAALPLMGSTVPRTLGLYAAGGPAGFMAQQQATRSILQAADYGEIAKEYDPLDLTGLLVSSLIPLPFVAHGIRLNLKAGKAAKAADARNAAESTVEAVKVAEVAKVVADVPKVTREQVDAAMTHNLTALADHHAAQMEAELAPISRAEREANFKAWFGDSKVVDADGKPLVVYHGAYGDVPEFDIDGTSGANFGKTSEGFAFFTNKADAYQDSASDYATRLTGPHIAPNVIPAFVALRNPLVIDAAGKYNAVAAFDSAADRIREEVRAGNHDGVIVRYGDGSSSEVLIAATRPEQIKSAIGNSGRFDRNSASLTDPIEGLATRPEGPAEHPKAPAAPLKEVPPTEAPSAQTLAAAVKAIEMETPDLKVTDDMTAAEFLERARKEAAEGADDELGAMDVDLVRVAVECALVNGVA